MTTRITVLLGSVALSLLVALSGVVLLAPADVDAAPTSVRTCGGGSIDLKSAEKNMLDRHNRARAARGMPELCIDPKLQQAARKHARDMLRRDYFSHTTKGSGDSFADRIRAEGYDFRYAAENIAYGTRSRGWSRNIFNNWMDSSGHRRNILDDNYREVGIALKRGWYQGSKNTHMWVADFGTPL